MKLDVVILAAGMGTRMKSALPKVLHPVAGRPMIDEVLAAARTLDPRRTVIVIGHGADAVRERVGDDAHFALQEEQLGTGHAMQRAAPLLADGDAGTVLMLFGDTPLIRPETLRAAVERHAERAAAVTLLSFLPDDPTGYGRIVRDDAGRVLRIVEHRDASDAERAIRECNGGIMLFDAPWLWTRIDDLELSPQGEYYLTDMVQLAIDDGRAVEAMVVPEHEVMGVNTRVHLAAASAVLFTRRREALMRAGVTMVDPATVWVDAGVEIGRDTILHPNCSLLGATTIGARCELGPNLVLDSATLADGVRARQSEIRDSTVAAGASVGPFALVRGGSEIGPGAVVGAGAEINRSRLGAGSRVTHFGYLGDARVGEGANIGAGTVTCNFDGMEKHPTTIGRDAFIGSDTLLVAPVQIGERGRTGAGAVVTRDVAEGELVKGVPARPASGRGGDAAGRDVEAEGDTRGA